MMAAMLVTPMMAAVAFATDVSVWFLERQRLQLAVDCGAYAGAMQLSNASMQSGAPSSYQTVVANEISQVVGNRLLGTLGTPVISVSSGYTSITVTLSTKADIFFARALHVSAPTITATATATRTAAAACVLALNPSAAAAMTLSNGSSISASTCAVNVNSTSSSAITMVSGTITGKTVSTSGGTSLSAGATITPTATTGAAAATDPYASTTMPSFGGCSYASGTGFSQGGMSYSFSNGTRFCGTTQIGGNGSTATFAAGIYYFTGNTTFNDAVVTFASGVTLVITGATAATAAPSFSWINNSGTTLASPTSTANGGVVGVAIWQPCPTGYTNSNVNGLMYFDEGSTLSISGAVYAPCATLQVADGAGIAPVSGQSASYVANEFSLPTGGKITAAATTSSSSTSVALTQ